MNLAKLTLAALAALVLGACNRTPEVLKIGVAQPLSGNLAAQGQDMLNGARMAADEINAQGGVRIGGDRIKIEVVPADDRADAGAGQTAARKLVDAGVLAAVAHLNSGVSIAAAPLYAQAGIPQLAISTKPAYTQLGHPTTLRLVANDELQSRAMADFAVQLQAAERFAVVDDATPYGQWLADSAAKIIRERGKAVTLRRSLDNSMVNFEPLVAELGKASIDVVVTTLSDFQVESLIRQLAKDKLTHVRVLGGDTIKTDRLQQVAHLISGVYATSPIIEAREFVNGAAFLDRFRARFKGEPVYGAHYAYDAVHVVADALTRNGSTDRAKLLEQLKTFDGNAPVTGTMRFRADGEQRYGAVAVYQLRGGQWSPLMRSDRW